jgi:transposase
MARLGPFFPKSHGRPRVDARGVLGGINFINRNDLRWCDAPKEYDPAKTLSNRWRRWSDKGIFARIRDGMASETAVPKTVMIAATYPKAQCTANSLRSKVGESDDQRGRLVDRTNGGINTKLHAVSVTDGRPVRFLLTAGEVSDHTGAAALLGRLPMVEWLLADRGHDADWLRDALRDKGVSESLPFRRRPRRNRHVLAMKGERILTLAKK